MAVLENDLDDPRSREPVPRGAGRKRPAVIAVALVGALVTLQLFVMIDPYRKLASLTDAPVPAALPAPIPLPEEAAADGQAWEISGAVLAPAEPPVPSEPLRTLPTALSAGDTGPEPMPDLAVFGRGSDTKPEPAIDLEGAEEVGSVAPEADAHIAAYRIAKAPEIEAAMRLPVAVRREVQRRLSLFGYDTKGIDGALGPNSRAAIGAWQKDYGFPDTGYLNAAVLASIRERTQVVWEEWQAAEQERAAARLAAKAVPRETVLAVPEDGCARDADGLIIADQSLRCDFKRARQRFADLLGDDPNDLGTAGFGPAGAER